MRASIYAEHKKTLKGDPGQEVTRKLCVQVGEKNVHLDCVSIAVMHEVAPDTFTKIRAVNPQACRAHKSLGECDITGDAKVAVEATALIALGL